MRRSIDLRVNAPTTSPHPPYGLFPDPHTRGHAWWAVDTRALLGFTALIAALGTTVSIIAH